MTHETHPVVFCVEGRYVGPGLPITPCSGRAAVNALGSGPGTPASERGGQLPRCGPSRIQGRWAHARNSGETAGTTVYPLPVRPATRRKSDSAVTFQKRSPC